MLISKDLYLFLKDYMKWVNNGAVVNKPYFCFAGLCYSIEVYTEFNDDGDELRGNLLSELKSLFKAEGLDTGYPFGEHNYDARFRNKTQHLDPIRLEWIKDHIEEYENALVTA